MTSLLWVTAAGNFSEKDDDDDDDGPYVFMTVKANQSLAAMR